MIFFRNFTEVIKIPGVTTNILSTSERITAKVKSK